MYTLLGTIGNNILTLTPVCIIPDKLIAIVHQNYTVKAAGPI